MTKIQSAASVVLRDEIQLHMKIFAPTIRHDRVAGQSVTAAYVDGLAGAVALVVAGGHGSRSDVVEATIKSLREAIDRDLTYLAST